MSVFQTFSSADDDDDASRPPRRPADYADPATPTAPRRPTAPMLPAWLVPERGDRALGGLLWAIVPLALVYLALLNPYWVPSGDGEVYTAIARSLVQGQGLTFNGARAAIAPPGWPLVLSGLMRISPEFLFLKGVTIACMLGSFVSVYYILRRFVSDRLAALIVVLSGTLSTIYPLTFWMHTEAFFGLLGFAAILIAFRIAEGRARPTVEVPLMLALLGFGAFTRWPGVLHLVLIVPILLSGRRRPWARPTRWLTILAVCLASVGTFRATYSYLSLTPEEKRIAMRSGGGGESDGEEIAIDPATTLPTTLPTTDPEAATQPAIGNPQGDDDETPSINTLKSDRGPVAEIVYRMGLSGLWFSWLLWQPTRFGSSVSAVWWLGMAAGWLTIGLLACTMIASLPRRNYFWVGLAIYTGGLCVIWPNPNARYFVPVAPFILLGVILGLAELGAWFDSMRLRRAHRATAEVVPAVDPFRGDRRMHLLGGWRILAIVFVATLALNNLPLLAIDVSIFRSRDFYGRYEAGMNKELIAVAQHIAANPPTEGRRIVVSERYDNLGRARWSKYAMRAMHLLTNQPIAAMEHKARLSNRPGADVDIRKWLRSQTRGNAQYYVYQSAWHPWRVWHLRLTPDWQATLAKRRPSTRPFVESGGWELYEREGMLYEHRKINENTFVPPRRVPGL